MGPDWGGGVNGKVEAEAGIRTNRCVGCWLGAAYREDVERRDNIIFVK